MTSTHHAKKGLTSISLRFESSQKKRIEDAAFMLGLSPTQFARTTLLDRAQEVAHRHSVTTLSNRDRDIFLVALDRDERPNAALRRAARQYKQMRHGR